MLIAFVEVFVHRYVIAAFPETAWVGQLQDIYVFGIRGEGRSATHRAAALMKQKRFPARLIHTHTFSLEDLPTAIRYAKDRVDDAIKVVVKAKMSAAHRTAAE